MPARAIPGEASLRALPDRLLVACSGGVDSVALLHALVQVGRKPAVLHFDHGWRAESAADAKWLGDRARQLGLKFIGGKIPVAQRRSEAVARQARYAFFAKAARRLKTKHLVLAHHADDQVETFLLQLFRGSGSDARGMDAVTSRDGLTLHRPWLGVWKKEILAYARAEKLTWREDATNADPRHRRNLLRGKILPYLAKQLGPQVAENLRRAAEIARAESQWLDQLCAEAAPRPRLSVPELRAAPLARQRRTILRWLQAQGAEDIRFTEVEAIRGLLDNVTPAKVNLARGKHVRRRAGAIFME